MLLLPGSEDRDIWHYFATASMPDRERAERVLARPGRGRPALSTPALEALVDIRRTPLELLLKVLDVDGAVERVQGGWIATGQPWIYDAERYGRIAAARVRRAAPHDRSTRTPPGAAWSSCSARLDDDTATPCGRCDNCAGGWFPTDIAEDATEAAAAALSRVGVPSNRGCSGPPAWTASACP